MSAANRSTLSCACGRFQLEVVGAPIIAAECHCNSCREAAARLGSLPSAPPLPESNGGTQFVMYRKDRVRFPEGTGLLKEHRLKPESPTRRLVTSCCHTPILLDYQGGHWLSVYARLWPADARPAMKLRVSTADLPAGTSLGSALPSGRLPTLGFVARLLAAWVAMGFRKPRIVIEGGELRG